MTSRAIFIPNSLKRQAIGDRDKLVANNDGSVDIYIEAISPAATRRQTGSRSARSLHIADAALLAA
jgi:hypothetical protein